MIAFETTEDPKNGMSTITVAPVTTLRSLVKIILQTHLNGTYKTYTTKR